MSFYSKLFHRRTYFIKLGAKIQFFSINRNVKQKRYNIYHLEECQLVLKALFVRFAFKFAS